MRPTYRLLHRLARPSPQPLRIHPPGLSPFRISPLASSTVPILSAAAPTRASPAHPPLPSSLLRLFGAAAATLFALTLSPPAPSARAEDGESRPPWEAGRSQPLRWSALVETLAGAQAALPGAEGFTARRRRRAAAANADEEHGDSRRPRWEFRIEFAADESCDMFDVFSSLMHAFGGGGATTVQAEELATKTTLRARQPRGFELAVTVPRRPGVGVDRVVMLELLREEADARFSANEVAAVVRAYRRAQGGETVRSEEGGGSREFQKAKVAPRRVPLPTSESVRWSREVEGVEMQRSVGEGKEEAAIRKLEELGVEVFTPDRDLNWTALAGYEEEKRVIIDSVVLPLTHPELYEGIVRETRKRYETVLPRAVLMTGLPGCGKSTAARILANSIGLPFINLKVEVILSKYFGETTKKLSEILETTRDLGPCVIFCDEIDSLGSSRDDPESHEVTRRTLSVLLRFLDGLDGPQQSVLVAATNVPDILDAALISRFDVVIPLGLPDLPTRTAILGLYAQQLSEGERESLAAVAEGFSGRELRDACKAAERACAGRAVRAAEKVAAEGEEGPDAGEASAKLKPMVSLPEYTDYCDALRLKARTSVGARANSRRAKLPTEPL